MTTLISMIRFGSSSFVFSKCAFSQQRPWGGSTVWWRPLSGQQAVWFWLAELVSTTESWPLKVWREDRGPQDCQQVQCLLMIQQTVCYGYFLKLSLIVEFCCLQFPVFGARWGQVIVSCWRHRLWHLPQRCTQTGNILLFMASFTLSSH